MEKCTLLLSSLVSDEILDAVAAILCEQWGGSHSNRIVRLKESRDVKSYILLHNVSCQHGKILDSDDNLATAENVIGAADIKHAMTTSQTDTIGAGILNGIVTSVIINPDRRRKGWGSILLELLHNEAMSLGFGYLYLWTDDAVLFYKKLGYMECESVSSDVMALKTLNEESLQKLENIFQNRLLKACRGSQIDMVRPLPNSSSSPKAYVWMRKRIIHKLCVSRCDSSEFMRQTTQQLKFYTARRSDCFDVQAYDTVFCSTQIGPSCGVAAIAVVFAYFSSILTTVKGFKNPRDGTECIMDEGAAQFSNVSSNALSLAIEAGFSSDGELFNVHHLAAVITSLGIIQSVVLVDARVVPAAEVLEPQSLTEIVKDTSRTMVIFPYDRDQRGNLPCECGGHHSHYAVVTGYARPMVSREKVQGIQEQSSKQISCENGGQGVVDVDADQNLCGNSSGVSTVAATAVEDVIIEKYTPYSDYLLVCMQGMSQLPVVAPLQQWLASNSQLTKVRTGKNSEAWVVDAERGPELSGQCVVVTLHI